MLRVQGVARAVQCSAIVAAVLCLLVVLFQLNGRIASDPGPLIQGDVAPFEWAGAHGRSLLLVASCAMAGHALFGRVRMHA
jgi:hypothetical protein